MVLREEFSRQELLGFVYSISRYNRIQGSQDLEKALKYVYSVLSECKNLSVQMYSFDYAKSYGIHHPLIGWDVTYAEVRLVKPTSKLLHTIYDSRTVVVAHSPPGVVEAPIVYVGEGVRERDYKDKDVLGKIVLAYGNPYLVYMTGIEYGVKGFVFFRRRGPENAVPYLGLFLEPRDVPKATAPAVAISRKNAVDIINKLDRGSEVVVRILVEAKYRSNAQIHVVEAKLGDSEREVHIYAHICHPGGTVNDNVSGSATLLELAHAFDRAVSKGKLSLPKDSSIVFVWFPEYYGSLPYLMTKTKSSDIIFGINLDMIGERQEITNSTLNFIRSPSIMRSPYEALMLYELLKELSHASTISTIRKSLSYRLDVLPYERGSDHDMYLQLGIPSVMINQWPDYYYHTDLDTVDKFDPEIAKSIAIAVGTAAYIIASKSISDKTLTILNEYYDNYIRGLEILRTPLGSLDKRYHSVAKGEEQKVKYRYVAEPGAISLRIAFSKLPREDFYEFLDLIEEDKYLWNLVAGYIPIILRNKAMTIEEIAQQILDEYGVEVKVYRLEKLLSYLVAMGLVERVKDIK